MKKYDVIEEMTLLQVAHKVCVYYVSDIMMRKYRKKALAELEEYYHKKEQEEIEYMLS